MSVHLDNKGRRILGLTFDGHPIMEPANAGSSITFAAAGAQTFRVRQSSSIGR